MADEEPKDIKESKSEAEKEELKRVCEEHGVEECHTCFSKAAAIEYHAERKEESFGRTMVRGITITNPVFILLLGLCPTLAVSTSIENAIGMSAAVLFVLICSNIIIASIRKWVPNIVRIPIFIVIIATFVTIVDLVMKAYMPELSKSLSIYVPLIVVNCIILGRAEAFASKHTIKSSFADAIGIGIGFFGAIFIISFLRQMLGTGAIGLGDTSITIPGISENPLTIFILPMGAFLVIGLLLALFRYMGVMESE